MCPACSGNFYRAPSCPCGEKMADAGPVSDYYGPYSPYFSTCFESDPYCVHLFSCPCCGHDTHIRFKLRHV
ncbi:MAG: hypothetical protein ACOY31_04270 [Bacillota bacterium]